MRSAHFRQDFREPAENSFLVELIAVKLKSFDELLDGALGFERKQG
jgi:hypothetical protein